MYLGECMLLLNVTHSHALALTAAAAAVGCDVTLFQQAIWLRKAKDISEEEYNKFYKAVSKVGL
jgi:HSP90 family molecular chaperone